MIVPPNLVAGDSVYLLNIARKGVFDTALVTTILKDWGLNPVMGPTLSHGDGFCQFSADTPTRLQDLQAALDNPDIKAIFFMRGGYGTVQLLDAIDFSGFVAAPKWIIGYSDITYLHAHINRNFGIATLHGAMFSAWQTASQNDLESIRKTLFGMDDALVFEAVEAHRFREVTGEIVGGNLSILHTLSGTASALVTDGKILFIEDVFENLTSIERMLWNLRRSGKCDHLKALLVGDFLIPIKDNETSNCMVAQYPMPDETTIVSAFRQMLLHFFEKDDFPVIFGLEIGHAPARNIAIASGRTARLNLQGQRLELHYLNSKP